VLDTRQERDPAFPHEGAVALLLGVADALDLCDRDGGAEVAREDRVVPLAERREEAVVRQRDALDSERRAPGEPVVLGRVEQRAVHVPEDGPRDVIGRAHGRARSPVLNAKAAARVSTSARAAWSSVRARARLRSDSRTSGNVARPCW